jgi:hypothetical protein
MSQEGKNKNPFVLTANRSHGSKDESNFGREKLFADNRASQLESGLYMKGLWNVNAKEVTISTKKIQTIIHSQNMHTASPLPISRFFKICHHRRHDFLSPLFPFFSVLHGIRKVLIRRYTKHITLLQFRRQRNDVVVKKG